MAVHAGDDGSAGSSDDDHKPVGGKTAVRVGRRSSPPSTGVAGPSPAAVLPVSLSVLHDNAVPSGAGPTLKAAVSTDQLVRFAVGDGVLTARSAVGAGGSSHALPDRGRAITMKLVPDDALVSPRYTSDRVAESKTLPPKDQRQGLTKFKVPDKAKQQLKEAEGGGGLWGLLNPRAFQSAL